MLTKVSDLKSQVTDIIYHAPAIRPELGACGIFLLLKLESTYLKRLLAVKLT